MKVRSASLPLFMSALTLAAVAFGGPGRAQEPTPPAEPPAETEPADEAPKSVDERLDEIDQKLRVLDRKTEIKDEGDSEKAKTATSVTSGKDGFSFKSADGAYVLKLRGYVQFDGRFFSDDRSRPNVDTFLLRRARPIFEGTVFDRFDFRIMPDFGQGTSVLFDAYIEGRFAPAFKVRAGKFKPPVGIERLQGATDIFFVERALPTNLVPNRDLVVQVSGDLAAGRATYAVGVWNGVVDGANGGDLDSNSGKDVAARLFFTPFAKSDNLGLRGLGFGVAASQGTQNGTLTATGLPSYRTDAQQTFFSYRSDGTAAGTVMANGDRKRLLPQLTWYGSRFGLLSEYTTSSQEVRRGAVATDLENKAWQVAGSWVIAGGSPSYRGVAPKKNFDPKAKTWGAFELVGRFSELDVDDDAFPLFASPTSSASSAKAWSLGLNWYLNRSVRWMFDLAQTRFEGGAVSAPSGIGDRPDERVVFSRFQINF
ncbi:MAG: porin [Acidobacteriota bacterium]